MVVNICLTKLSDSIHKDLIQDHFCKFRKICSDMIQHNFINDSILHSFKESSLKFPQHSLNA